jgi:hypothetical protein
LPDRKFALVPRFDDYNQIVDCQLRRKVEGEEEAIFYTLNSPNEENTIFQNMLTNQTYSIFNGDHGEPSVLLVEIELSRIIQQGGNIFS